MSKLDIKIMKDPILREKAKEIDLDKEEEQTAKLADDMFETMLDADGIGLAGNQVGLAKRIFILNGSDDELHPKPLVLINPKITAKSEKIIESEEGCLSIPGIYYSVPRFEEIEVEFYDKNLKPKKISLGKDLIARAVQHELDHLNGVLFTDYLSKLKQKRVFAKMEKLRKELGLE
jgi:peptide deformylase